MNISIKPAEIVGAEVGTRVSWSTGRCPGAVRTYGTIVGISTAYADCVEVAPEGEGERRHISPGYLTLAPKKYAVGDRVSLVDDGDALPNGTILIDHGDAWLPAFKRLGEWFVIDPHDEGDSPRKAVNSTTTNRNIAWMPSGYCSNS